MGHNLLARRATPRNIPIGQYHNAEMGLLQHGQEIVACTRNGVITRANQSVAGLLQTELRTLVGQPAREFLATALE
ncbi:MAG: hypothetical protein JNJ44_08990 [Zoogloeaceae bacterium]|nr:hypothetical protein [Zoogloeaceae bacterium]